jgi:hypothetical protein
MAPKLKLKASVEHELRSLFVCPDALQEQLEQCCAGKAPVSLFVGRGCWFAPVL